MELKIAKTQKYREKPQDESALGFGRIFTDHMFLMDYSSDKGWFDPRIVPYGPIELYPSSACLHYAQEVFEGLKAYLTPNGTIQLFRPYDNFKRMNLSNERMVIPEIPIDTVMNGLTELLKIDSGWMPKHKGTSLYIRPFIIATDQLVGVHPSHTYLFCIILSPVGAYYSGGLNPVDIYVEDVYVRSVRGGTGFAKTGGNYAASLRSQENAAKQNYSQVLWLDGIERKFVEEVGAMNIFFVLDGKELVTPALQGSILPGITRQSTMELAKSWGLTVTERAISIDEVAQLHKENRLTEIFGTGTAAVISPVGKLKHKDNIMVIGGGKIGEISQKLYDTLTGIQQGDIEDSFGWTVKIK